MNKTCFTLLLLLTTIGATAQKATGIIKGIVKNGNGNTLAICSILLQQKDSTAAKGSITDSTGAFRLEAKPGTYVITASMTGFEPVQTAVFSVKENEEMVLPVITLKTSAKNLDGVTVTARKKLFEMQPDKMVMNIENSVLATGNTVFDVLRRAPAVTIDKDDNVKLKGAVSQIFIDGKPSYMSGQQLTDYLKSLPADAVSKIEFITNPSSKYDAAGSSGIINIKLKKNQAYGLNGTATIGGGVGRYAKGNGGINLNYRKDKLNLFGSSYTGYSMSYNELTLNSIFNNNGVINYQDRSNYWHPTSLYSSYKGGADYSLGKNSTIGVLYRGSLDHTDARTDNSTVFKNSARQPTSFVQSVKNDSDRTYNHFFNLNYKATLDTLGSELNVDADYAVYKKNSIDINENYFYDGQMKTIRPSYLFRNRQPATGTIKALKADYTKIFVNKMKLETGFKISQVNSDNDLIVDSLTDVKNWQKDYSRSNHFVYDENIYAAYATFTQTFGKTSVQAGLRAEQTNSTGNSITLNKVDKRSYLDFFPTLFVSQTLSENHQLNFSYSRRINRPGYQSLNPFVNFIDPFTYMVGNPYLRPSYSSSFELKHGYKQFLFTSFSYRHATDVQTMVVRQNKATGVNTTTTENANSSDYLRLDVTASLPITKWWSSDNNIGVAYGRDYSTIPDFSFNTKAFGADFSSSNTFTLPKNYKLQTSINYSLPTRDGLAFIRSYYSWDMGIQKQIWNNKATLKLNASNIIGPSAYRSHLVSDNLDITWKNKWEGRRLNLSFVYKFGSTKIKASRSRSTASQQEQNRY